MSKKTEKVIDEMHDKLAGGYNPIRLLESEIPRGWRVLEAKEKTKIGDRHTSNIRLGWFVQRIDNQCTADSFHGLGKNLIFTHTRRIEADKPAEDKSLLIPRHQHEKTRMSAISFAIVKKCEDGKEVPPEWIEELRGLNSRRSG